MSVVAKHVHYPAFADDAPGYTLSYTKAVGIVYYWVSLVATVRCLWTLLMRMRLGAS